MNLTNAIAAQRLWRGLAALCDEAGQSGLLTDQMGYILHEFALGLFALTLSKEDLSAFLSIARKEVESDPVMIVNALHGSSSPLAWSWVHGLSGVSAADPRFQASAAIELAK